MKSFVVVHNIPSPYRLHLFNVLNDRLRELGMGFHVHFMAYGHEERKHWHIDEELIKFPYTVWKDIGPVIRGTNWHLNPGLIAHLSVRKVDYLMLGGIWDSLTNAVIDLSGLREVCIAWLEGNTHTIGRTTGFVGRGKSLMLSRCQFVAVPGTEGGAYVRRFLSDSRATPRVVTLPNIINEKAFRSTSPLPDVVRQEIRTQLGLDPARKVAVWPARLIPAKGVLEFLSRMEPEDLSDWNLVILGQGPLKEMVDELIVARNLRNHVCLQPYVSYDKMPLVYAAADLFLLPSISDPNPLSVVEAMHAGLPLLISNRVGNYPEALQAGSNGWGFDPMDSDSVKRSLNLALSSPLDQLRSMGQKSQLIADEFWNSTRAVRDFLDAVIGAQSDK